MQSLYEFLKASKGLPVSDSYAALWGKSAAESGIKTLTGRLPIFFKTSENKLRDWVIYGNNEPGKNLISVEDTAGQNPGITITRRDEQTGSIEATTTSGRRYAQIYWYPEFEEGQTYILSCYVNEVNEHARICLRTKSENQVVVNRWFTSTGAKTMKFTYKSESYPGGVYVSLMLNDSAATEGEVNVSKLMLRKAGTSEAFEPYQIGVGEKTKNLVENIEQGSWVPSSFVKITAAKRCRVGNVIDVIGSTQYTFCAKSTNSSAVLVNLQYKNDAEVSKGESGWINIGTSGSTTVTTPSDATKITAIVAIDPGNVNCTPSDFADVMFTKGSTAPATFIPYGYVLNIGVGPAPISSMPAPLLLTRKTINLGVNPLTEGQTLSMAEFGDIAPNTRHIDLFIAAFEGFNYDSQLSYNQPTMMIKFKE